MLVQIDYLLTFTAPFHMGTGIRAGLIDRTIMKNSGGLLYVPASTLKGVVREYCERLLRFYLPAAQARVFNPHDANEVLIELGKAPTLVTRIFGSQLHPGGLRFGDATMLKPEYQEIQSSISTQVRIDRRWRTAVEDALYTSEYGIPFLKFTGSIKGSLDCTPIPSSAFPDPECRGDPGVPAPTYSLLLLLAGLLMLEQIGGNKSAGKGQCTCEIEMVTLDRQPCATKTWQCWIKHLDVLSSYPLPEKEVQA
jgi:CRISPR/Cas system CSM-associated protein Csm3 (group 7 of RAMP superfamily)